jgi:hypothetical protein
LCERVGDFLADVRRIEPSVVTAAIEAACRDHGARRPVVH